MSLKYAIVFPFIKTLDHSDTNEANNIKHMRFCSYVTETFINQFILQETILQCSAFR